MTRFFITYFLIFLLLIESCRRNANDASNLRAVIQKTRKSISKEYYLPSYHEKNFPSPQILLKKLPQAVSETPIEIHNGSRSAKKVALTFDACSTLLPSQFDSVVAQILIDTQTPATIFFGGKWVLDRPKDALMLASVPFFEIGNHTYLHGHLPRVSEMRLYYEILWTQEIIYSFTGKVPTLFRPPYLESDNNVTAAAARIGLKTVCGDLPSGDPDHRATKTRLLDEIKNHIRNGSIIIMHINRGGKHTAESLADIIQTVKNMGFEPVTVSQLLEPDSSSSASVIKNKK